MIVAQREMLRFAQSELTVSRLEIERYKLMLAKARREQYGQSSERARHLIEQLELAIEDLEETQAAEQARVEMTSPTGVKEKQARSPRQPRRPLPDNLRSNGSSNRHLVRAANAAASACASSAR